MNTYQFKHSRLANYPYLCMQIYADDPVVWRSTIEYCQASFGNQGTKEQGRWYSGLLGIYFNQLDDAVQFILACG